MTRSFLPFAIAFCLIVGLTFVEGYYMKDRWGSLAAVAEELGQRFDQVPKEIGPWVGEDLSVDEQVRRTAGAVRYVSRRYTHSSTGKTVTLWLIIGHSRDIVRHTPNTCFPASGFTQLSSVLTHHMETADGSPAVFATAKFQKENMAERAKVRVFWAWNHPEIRKWEAPEDPRGYYGLSRALYKLYFTSTAEADEATVEDNAAAQFAEVMLPAINVALFPEQSPVVPAEDQPAAETGVAG